MSVYQVVISEDAQNDLRNLSNVISYQYKAPLTSLKYLKSIYAEMGKLSHSADSFKIESNKSFQQYGSNPRRINYKEIAIIYNLINDVVYILRVIPANTIQDL